MASRSSRAMPCRQAEWIASSLPAAKRQRFCSSIFRKREMAGTRVEKDGFGPIEVDAERLWGAQTERSRRFFRISGERMPRELVHALVLVKKAAALVQVELG